MTQTAKRNISKTSLYPLFQQKFNRFLDKKAKKTAKKAPAAAIHGENFCQKKFTGKEQDAETGLYYYGARYLDPRAGRWLSGDPAVGEYIPSAPVNDEARKRNGSLPGMGGVFNYANLHAYVGKEVQGHTGTYYRDKISIKFKGIPLNSIQAQTTVDYTSRYDASEATPDGTTKRATIGVDAPTNQLARDTIRFDDEKGNFLHRPVTDNGRPYSGGCAIPPTNADKEEVMDILRNDLGFENGSQIDWTFTKPHTGQLRDNIE